MEHRFHFTASRFNATEVRSYFINECCFGDDVIAWLRERMTQTAADADIGEPVQEDWGWGFWLELGDDRYWIYASVVPEDGHKDARHEWLVGIDGQEPLFAWRRDMRTRRLARFDGLVAMLRTIVASDPGNILVGEEDD